MIINKVIKNNRGYAICTCDYCGKEIIKRISRLNDKQYYNNHCSSMKRVSNKFGLKTYKNVRSDCHCIVCGKPYDDSFWDKGDKGRADHGGQRYLCSKTCRDLLFTTLDTLHGEYNKNIYNYELNRKMKVAI